MFSFKQQAHMYVQHLPNESDTSSWLALMQHYGAPTRFLDWTHSQFVSLFFALEDPAIDTRAKSAIWALDLGWLETQANKLLQASESEKIPADPIDRAAYWNTTLSCAEHRLIIKVDPLLTDNRMAAQQGVFLCKLDQTPPFNQILIRMMVHPELIKSPVIYKLEIPRSLRYEFLTHLREMNIHHGSLFPGLEGFARSLRLNQEIKVHQLSQAPGMSFEAVELDDNP